MSGGWRMRVALGKALFVKPSLLLLDDPTAHLDLEACVWLEEYLKKWDRTLDPRFALHGFLERCLHKHDRHAQKKLMYYGGNYDSYIKTRTEQETNQRRHTTSSRRKLRTSRSSSLPPVHTPTWSDRPSPGRRSWTRWRRMASSSPLPRPRLHLPIRRCREAAASRPVLRRCHLLLLRQVARTTSTRTWTSVSTWTRRTALVGPNGVGKSTLLRHHDRQALPTGGAVSRHTHLKLGLYSQHSAEQLDLTKSALGLRPRQVLLQVSGLPVLATAAWPIRSLRRVPDRPDGHAVRGPEDLVSCSLCWPLKAPTCFCLTSLPTVSIFPPSTRLADAINAFTGGVVVVSHDFR